MFIRIDEWESHAWPMPPAMVNSPHTSPRRNGVPRPDSFPSSANPIETPAPTEAAKPTRKAFHELCRANAAANTGGKVDTKTSHVNP